MAVYGGQRGGLASRMGTYDSEAGSSNNMFGLNDQGKENVANFTGSIKDKIKGALTKAGDAYGDVKSQGYIGKHKGIDFLHGAPTMKDIGQGIGTAYGNVRKFFGDRLNAVKEHGKSIGGVKSDVKASPINREASLDANNDNTVTLDEKTGIDNMEGPTQGASLGFDASQTPLDKLTGDQLSQWGQYFNIENPTMNQYANWQQSSERDWNNQNDGSFDTANLSPFLTKRGQSGRQY